MDEETVGQQLERALGEAITKTLAEFDGSFLIKWVTVAEVLDMNGDRGIWSFTSPGAKRWDIQGMLMNMQQFQIAHMVVEIMEDHQHGGDE